MKYLPITSEIKERFWNKVRKTPYCWIWKAGLNSSGYGQFYATGFKERRAHRFSFLMTFGRLPQKISVLHTCDNPKCVNPFHLFLGTQKDNLLDMNKKGRNIKGELCHQSKLTKKDVLKIRKLYASKKHSQSMLGRMFRVTRESIRDIVNRKNWKHL